MDPVFPSTIRIAHTTTLSVERDIKMEDMEGTMIRVRISPVWKMRDGCESLAALQ